MMMEKEKEQELRNQNFEKKKVDALAIVEPKQKKKIWRVLMWREESQETNEMKNQYYKKKKMEKKKNMPTRKWHSEWKTN